MIRSGFSNILYPDPEFSNSLDTDSTTAWIRIQQQPRSGSGSGNAICRRVLLQGGDTSARQLLGPLLPALLDGLLHMAANFRLDPASALIRIRIHTLDPDPDSHPGSGSGFSNSLDPKHHL
jgi:hypothetical protein